MKLPGLPPPKPIPLKERAAMVFVERAQIDVRDGACVAIDVEGVRTHIPIGGIACLMLEPGARISHAAVALAGRAGTLVTWVGEGGVRLYSAGQPGGARSDNLLWQAKLALDDSARLRVVRAMYARRFGEEPPARRSIDQLRGIEGQRVRHAYDLLADRHGVKWTRRKYDVTDWGSGDVANRCLSSATACLHGLSEAAVLERDTPPPSASCTRASRAASSTTLRTSGSWTRWCRRLFASPRKRSKARCRWPLNGPCVWRAATRSESPAC